MRLTVYLIILIISVSLVYSQTYPVETVVQTGHTDNINALEFSPDGRFFITGSQDKTLKIWDLRTGVEIRTFSGHSAKINSIAIHPDNTNFYSVSGFIGGAEIKIWDVYTGEEIKSIDPKEAYVFVIRDVAVDPSGSTIAIADDKKNVKLLDSKRGRLIKELETDLDIRTVVFNHQGNLIAAGGGDAKKMVPGKSRMIYFWNTPNYNLQKKLTAPNNSIKKIIFSNDDQLMACLSISESGGGAYDNQISVFDLKTDRIIYNITDTGWEIEDFAFSPDGKYIAYPQSKFDTTIRISAYNLLQDYAVKSNLEDKDKIYIYNVLNQSLHDTIETDEFRIYSIGFSPDNKILIANGEKINSWATANWSPLKIFNPTEVIENVIHGPGETSITTVKYDNKVKSYVLNQMDLSTLKYKYFFDTLNNLIYDAAENQYIQSRYSRISIRAADDYREGKILFDSIPGWRKIDQLLLDHNHKNVICANRDTNMIFVGSLKDPGIKYYLSGHRQPVNTICLNPEEKILASGSDDRKIFLWDLDKMEKINQFAGHNDNIGALAFNPSGTVLSSGSEDGYIKLWDIQQGKQITTLTGHNNDVNALSFNLTGTLLVSGSGNTFSLFGGESEVIYWDIQKNKILKKLPGNEGYIKKIVNTPDGKYFLSIGNDPFVKFFDTETGTDILSYMPVDKDNYILYTPDNYYTTTKSGIQNIYFIKGLEIYTFDNFDLKFNRPDIILQRLGYANENLIKAYTRAYQKRLKKLNFTEEMLGDDFHVPTIKIMNREDLAEKTNKSEIILDLQASDDLYKIDRINIWINDVPVYGINGIDVRSKNANQFRQKLNLELAAGKNSIQVSALNQKGAESLKETIDLEYEKTVTEKTIYIAAVGISQYSDSRFNLKFAHKDAQDLVSLFRDGSDVFHNVVVKIITDEAVTRENITGIRNFFEQAGRDDVIMLFVAGHGMLDEQYDYYFASYNMNFDNPSEKGIEYSEIEALFDGLKALRKILIMDTCHSGEVDKEDVEIADNTEVESGNLTFRNSGRGVRIKHAMGLDNTNELARQLFADIRKGTGTTVVSSAGGAEYALEGAQWNNGLFTFCILEGLKNKTADLDGNGEIMVSELREYVTANVTKYSGGKQTPTSRIENIKMDFRIW